MPKAEAGTPKAISNAMKAKGLTKLRWYCQVCQKACRDENGFKCHIQSESHLRQMLLVGENAATHIDSFSQQFQSDFVALLSRRFGTKRIKANQVYQEYIQDRHHLHMNATRWLTLTEFVKDLGRQGVCHVDETEKGWFISWVDNSPQALARQEAIQKMQRQNIDDEQRQRKLLAEQMERAREAAAAGAGAGEGRSTTPPAPATLERKEGEKVKLSFSLGAKKEGDSGGSGSPGAPVAVTESEKKITKGADGGAATASESTAPTSAPRPNIFKTALAAKSSSSSPQPPGSTSTSKKVDRPLTAMEQIVLEEREKKRRFAAGSGTGSRSSAGMREGAHAKRVRL